MAVVTEIKPKDPMPIEQVGEEFVSDNGEMRVSFSKDQFTSANALVVETGGHRIMWYPTSIKYICMETGLEDVLYDANPDAEFFVQRGTQARFERPFHDAEEWFRVRGGRVKHDICLLGSQRPPLDYLIDPWLAVSGVIVTETGMSVTIGDAPMQGYITTDGSVIVASSAGAAVFEFPPVLAWDQNKEEVGGRYIVSPLNPGRFELATAVPYSWLNAVERAYPVIIDPTVMTISGEGIYENGHSKYILSIPGTKQKYAIIPDQTVWYTSGTTNYVVASLWGSEDDGNTWSKVGLPPDLASQFGANAGTASASQGYMDFIYEPVSKKLYWLLFLTATQIVITYDPFAKAWLPSQKFNNGAPSVVSMAPDVNGNIWVVSGYSGRSEYWVWFVPGADWSQARHMSGGPTYYGGRLMVSPQGVLYYLGSNSPNSDGNTNVWLYAITPDNPTNPTSFTTKSVRATPSTSTVFRPAIDLFVDNAGYAYTFVWPQSSTSITVKKFDANLNTISTVTVTTPQAEGNTSSENIGVFSPNGTDYYIGGFFADKNIWLSPKNPTGAETWEQITNVPGGGGASNTFSYGATKAVAPVASFDILHKPYGSTTLYYFKKTFNTAPLAPTITGPQLYGNDRAGVITATWLHNDPNPNDPQSKADLRWRQKGASTWNTITVNSPAQSYAFAAGSLPHGEIEMQVSTYDEAGLQSPWSATFVFVAGDKPATPTITTPIGTTVYQRPTVEWSSIGQQSYQLLVLDAFAATVWDSQEDTGDARARQVGIDLVNTKSYTFKLRTKNADGVWSDYAASTVTVSFTPPVGPVVSISKRTGFVLIEWSNPDPTGTQPAVVANEVWRREVGGTWNRIAAALTGGSYSDYHAASGTIYEYKVRAVGANETTTDSEVMQASIVLSGIWLHDVAAPEATVHCFKYFQDRSGGLSVGGTMLQFEGREEGVFHWDGTSNKKVSFRLDFTNEDGDIAMYRALVLRRSTLCYRDARGRKLFGVIAEVADKETHYGASVNADMQATSYSEEV